MIDDSVSLGQPVRARTEAGGSAQDTWGFVGTAVVAATGIVVGAFIGLVIGLFTGWISFAC